MRGSWEKWKRGMLLAAAAVLTACFAVACGSGVPGAEPTVAATATPQAPAYQAQTRDIQLIAYPIFVTEQEQTYDWLAKDFAQGGMLNGKEVYGFYPSTIVAYQGDTLNVTITNPEDDAHTFTIPDLNVNVAVPGLGVAKTSIVVTKPGTYRFLCEIEEHAPFMWGQLVVLPATMAQ